METTNTLVVMTMAMLIKLLATSIVASSIFGCSSKCDAIRALCFSFVFRKYMSFADNEKYAVSAPAITADISKSTRMAIMSMVAFDASMEDACKSKDVRCVSPSVLSKV